MNQTLLLELLTEELPPKALMKLANAFATIIETELKNAGFLSDSQKTVYATPRRLALKLTNVVAISPNKTIRLKILPVSVALDKNGNPTPPLQKKLTAIGFPNITISDMERAMDGKNESFFYTYTAPGISLSEGLQSALEKAISGLPIPKVMTYQRPDGKTVEFVRPVHGLLALHGTSVISLSILGLTSSDKTIGHRFLSSGEIHIPDATKYDDLLESDGKVIASFDQRKEKIRKALLEKAKEDKVLMPEELLDEVTALVEWPVVYECQFESSFLNVPQECLILTMQTNQKYFALTDNSNRLRSRFLIVSNMETTTPDRIIGGNERVIRPRLSDAQFFFEQDKKKRLEDRLPNLNNVVYHNKLGTLAQRMARVRQFAVTIAKQMKIDERLVDRAALLAKADLLTEMVGEFPELQGIMGTYYARHDGEPEEVALAVSEHYMPRFAGDMLPTSNTGTAVALADKLETLTGIWGIGLQPTGDRDPFALRRHALGVLRILMEKKLPLSLHELLNNIVGILSVNAAFKDPTAELIPFMMDRLRGLLRDRGYKQDEIEAILAQHPDRFDNIIDKLEAVKSFALLPESKSLAAANKRISNILKKSEVTAGKVQENLLIELSEKNLHNSLNAIRPEADKLFVKGDYTATLKCLANLQENVDSFFDNVMVMTDDLKLRNNRIALLTELHTLMNQVADISKLATN